MRKTWASAILAIAVFFSMQQNAPYIVLFAEVCRGPAAYPPDLPDCIDPAVLAAQEVAKKVAERNNIEDPDDHWYVTKMPVN